MFILEIVEFQVSCRHRWHWSLPYTTRPLAAAKGSFAPVMKIADATD